MGAVLACPDHWEGGGEGEDRSFADDELDALVLQGGMTQNEVRLQLHALAYNLGTFLQGADLPEEIADWALTALQVRLNKMGTRVVLHALRDYVPTCRGRGKQ